jgi:hypothetical protein
VGTAAHAHAQAEVDAEIAEANQESGDVNEELVDETFRALAEAAVTESTLEARQKLDASTKEKLNPSSLAQLKILVEVWREWWPNFLKCPLEDMPGTPLENIKTEQAFAIETSEVPQYEAPHLTATEKEIVLNRARLARELPSHGQRDYSSATDTEVCMTADLVGCGANGAVLIVVDYKTGRGPHTYAEHEDQMRCLGTAAGIAYGYKEVLVIVVWITPEGVKEYRRTLTELDMLVTVEELRRLVAKIDGAEPRAGLHCHESYCPAQSVCPAASKALTAVGLHEVDKVRLRTLEIRSDREALFAIQAKNFLYATGDRINAEVKAYADRVDGFEAPDGRVFKGRLQTRESPVLEEASAIIKLRAALGEDAAEAIKTKVTTTGDAIYKALQNRKARLEARAIETNGDTKVSGKTIVLKDEDEKIWDMLRELGAVRTTEFRKYSFKHPLKRRSHE